MAASSLLALPSLAGAQSASSGSDPQSRPIMSSEGAGITDVVDAFDMGSVWSLRFTAGYVRRMENARITRERSPVSNPNPGMNDYASGYTEFDDVGSYSRVTNTLMLNAELAVFHDLAITVGLPIILSDDQSLNAPTSTTLNTANERLRDGYHVTSPTIPRDQPQMGQPGVTQNAGGGYTVQSQLWNYPPGQGNNTDNAFRSPQRSGIDQFYLGFRWNILNQARDHNVPTWLFRFEWRIPVGQGLRPCMSTASGNYCPGNDERNPNSSAYQAHTFSGDGFDVNAPNGWERAGTNSPGISRRVHGLFAQTVVSRRMGYIEPYAGLEFLAEIPDESDSNSASFHFRSPSRGQLSTYPPITGALVAGMEIIPWENRETWQRFVVDLRLRGAYYSQGREYSQLYDALGSSNSFAISDPTYSVYDQASNNTMRPVFFSGTTTVQSHAEIGGALFIGIQPAKFLRFNFGGSVTWVQPHLITATDACNPNEKPDSPEFRAGCVGDATPDPQHRPAIDTPGTRFQVTDDIIWNVYLNLAFTPRL